MSEQVPISIKELKNMVDGTKISGVPLLIKTARATFRDAEENIWQEVVFMDATGEITGHILQDSYESEYKSHKTTGDAPFWRSKQRICVMEATIQDADIRRKEASKIVITECFNLAIRLTFEQRQELTDEDWKQLRQDEIKGKIRHGIICAMIQSPSNKPPNANDPKVNEYVNALVDFIITGE